MFNFASKVADEPAVFSVVLTGFSIVFGILLLFVLVFSLFGVFSKTSNKTKNESKSVPAKKAEIKPVQVVSATTNEDDDIIAVIAAAVYSMYDGTGKRAIIRSIKPSSTSGKSAWSKAGLMNNIKSF